ncbi:acetylxylan esterase [Negadavirga shengliensis]|uniref:Acetylxylan esterase n=1 Tax=Negadavirga shengliensis TaxID=1389218 RepID=A0ABV9SWM6_9BACT
MGKYQLYMLFFCVCFTAQTLFAQEKVLPINTHLDLVPEEENLDVFQQWIRWNNPGSLLIHHLTKQARDLYEKRDREIAELRTKSDWMNRQRTVRDKLDELAGTFPEKTLLKPQITGTIKRQGYRIDKIVFEAFPGYYVTGCLYVPEGLQGKAPAILNVIGHNQEAFRNPLYQVINHNLAMKGMIVLAIDPPGQGEHLQYFDPDINFSAIGYTVMEHNYFGNQCAISGVSAAKYFIWEGIRAIDYLVSRNDVDPDRIGVTGFSGGGTVTSYIAAFDDRVKVSVPCSWSTTNRRQLETKGIQDAEASFIGGLAEGITLEDFLEVRAPKPTLLTFTSRDEYLTLQGAREAYSEAKSAYKAFGLEDNIEMAEDDSKHWMTAKIRLAIYAFFMKHFNIPGDPAEMEGEVFSEEELRVTPTGQVFTSYGGDMIFDVNRKETEKLVEQLEKSRKNMDHHLGQVKVRAKELSGFIAPAPGAVEAFINGKYRREGYSVGKYAIMGEGDYAIPVLLFVPEGNPKKHPAIVYLHPKGKVTEAKPGGEIERLVKKGYVVAAADVLGVGETENTVANRQGTADAGNTAALIGRSVVGIQAGDILRVVTYLKALPDVNSEKIGAIGIDEMGIPLIHAAAFDPSIKGILLSGLPLSYRAVAMNRIYKLGMIPTGYKGPGLPYKMDFSATIAGVLTAYDLPDLLGCISPRKVALLNVKDHVLESASESFIEQEMDFPTSVYSKSEVPDNLKILPLAEIPGEMVDWCFQ